MLILTFYYSKLKLSFSIKALVEAVAKNIYKKKNLDLGLNKLLLTLEYVTTFPPFESFSSINIFILSIKQLLIKNMFNLQ